nr:GNAT family N-acetyltransferase [Clostridium tertium]
MDVEKFKLVRISGDYSDVLANFDCVNTNEDLKSKGFKSKKIKKFLAYSENINHFLKNEALEEQNQGLNTTFLLFNEDVLVGFVSLCNDSIRLAMEEKQEDSVPYANIPALKIARLAIDKRFQGTSLGELLIRFAVTVAIKIRSFSGVKFLTVDCYEHRLTYYRDKVGFKINVNQAPNRQPDNPLSLRLNIDDYLNHID